jgi:hypothetical protein
VEETEGEEKGEEKGRWPEAERGGEGGRELKEKKGEVEEKEDEPACFQYTW